MKNLIASIMYNLYMLNIIRKNRWITDYIKMLRDKHERYMQSKLSGMIMSEEV